MSKNVSIVIPTYNEHNTIVDLVRKIFFYIPQAHVVVVDDSESKYSQRIVNKLGQLKKDGSTSSLQIITRSKKLGRGSAVIDGFRLALTNRNNGYFIEMDGDLSHHPKELPDFLDAIRDTRSDVVVGSRYLSKSRIVDWPFFRLFLSKIINFFLELWLRVGLSDYTNGYRLYNRKAAAYLVKENLSEKGFILLSETAYLLHRNGFRFAEIPITFTDRKQGKSSVTLLDLFLSFIGAIRIKLR